MFAKTERTIKELNETGVLVKTKTFAWNLYYRDVLALVSRLYDSDKPNRFVYQISIQGIVVAEQVVEYPLDFSKIEDELRHIIDIWINPLKIVPSISERKKETMQENPNETLQVLQKEIDALVASLIDVSIESEVDYQKALGIRHDLTEMRSKLSMLMYQASRDLSDAASLRDG